jgi:hypothetical protein
MVSGDHLGYFIQRDPSASVGLTLSFGMTLLVGMTLPVWMIFSETVFVSL